MPRHGPRPYECVKRSWHSDRHQPIRGSIIQQIFRVVHEIHASGTKKNREWQAKLPLVVFKSEEIMYSKANSEAEYVDSETLWDRLNDAIDTIIKRDESTETGEEIPPCVEAALELGCVIVKTSRSQRNSNPRSYLTPRNQDSVAIATNARNLNASNVRSRPDVVDRTRTFSEHNNKDLRPNFNVNVAPCGSSFHPPLFENFPRINNTVSFENNRPSSSYPLYHGFHFQPQMGFCSTHQNSNNIIVGRPVFQPSFPKGCPERLFLIDRDGTGSKNEPRPGLAESECDLSLRLGLVSSSGKELTCVDGVDSGSRSKEFSFFPLNSEAEEEARDSVVRKRKAVGEPQQFLQLDPDFNQIKERMKRRGL
ncbi:hypothetical protein OSB04_031692 [Centaurea solstitialis]|uniref:Uncharacterized protein n=1 Tax=Centaurea solstitialis TaxID=347529 RepID=A0AA38SB81_9ASTR|nr:hypothetical protein OSB04_031692 [Centaurea solstitialis]